MDRSRPQSEALAAVLDEAPSVSDAMAVDSAQQESGPDLATQLEQSKAVAQHKASLLKVAQVGGIQCSV